MTHDEMTQATAMLQQISDGTYSPGYILTAVSSYIERGLVIVSTSNAKRLAFRLTPAGKRALAHNLHMIANLGIVRS